MFAKLINKFKPKKKEEESKIPIVMLALAKNRVPALKEVFKILAENNSEIDTNDVTQKDEMLIFDFDGDMVSIAFMPGPIPWSDLEGPCAAAWHWPEAGDTLKQHQAHILLAMMPRNEEKGHVKRALQLTGLIGQVVKEIDVLGVYWAAGTLVQPPKPYIDFLDAEEEGFPLNLWAEFRVQSNPDNTANVLTTGMAALGHMEIEVIKSPQPAADVLGFVLDIANYLLENGPVIKDGDTVGNSEDHIIKVSFKASVWDRAGKVMRIYY